MVITYHGNEHFRAQSGDLIIAIDPFRKIKADITIRLNSKETGNETEGLLIDHPGEYEIKETRIWGAPGMYILEAEEMRIALFGREFKGFGEDADKYLQMIDMAIVPAEVKMAQYLRQLKPSLIITCSEHQELNKFLQELGQTGAEAQEKLTIKKKELTPEAMKVVVLRG